MSQYKGTCNPALKKLVNESLFKEIEQHDSSTCGIFTLDADDNGTCSALRRLGYKGHFFIAQNNEETLKKQVVHWQTRYPNSSKYHITFGDIVTKWKRCLASLQTCRYNIKVWNFDSCSLYSACDRFIHNAIQDSVVSGQTSLFITFIASPNMQRMAQFKNLPPNSRNATLIERIRHSNFTHQGLLHMYKEMLQDTLRQYSHIEYDFVSFQHSANAILQTDYALLYTNQNGRKSQNLMCTIGLRFHTRCNSFTIPHLKQPLLEEAAICDDDTSIISPFQDNDIETEVEDGHTEDTSLFQHQISALHAIKNYTKGIIHMACGSGKTRIMFEQILQQAAMKPDSIIIVNAPWRTLVHQISKSFSMSNLQVIPVDSSHDDELKRHPNMTTVFVVCRNSLWRLTQWIHEHNYSPDLILVDEAHRKMSDTITNDDAQKELFQNHFRNSPTYYFTATPSTAMLKNEEFYGPVIYRYSYKESVEDNINRNFDIHIGLTDNDDVQEGEINRVQDLITLINNMIRIQDRKRILVFTGSVKEAANNIISLDEIEQSKSQFSEKYQISFIVGRTPKKQREAIFTRFSVPDDSVQIIVSCQTICEGLDLPLCDQVYLTSPLVSPATTIQKVMRAVRLTPLERKTLVYNNASIVIPLYINKKSYIQELRKDVENDKNAIDHTIQSSSYKKTINTLYAVQHDLGLNYAIQDKQQFDNSKTFNQDLTRDNTIVRVRFVTTNNTTWTAKELQALKSDIEYLTLEKIKCATQISTFEKWMKILKDQEGYVNELPSFLVDKKNFKKMHYLRSIIRGKQSLPPPNTSELIELQELAKSWPAWTWDFLHCYCPKMIKEKKVEINSDHICVSFEDRFYHDFTVFTHKMIENNYENKLPSQGITSQKTAYSQMRVWRERIRGLNKKIYTKPISEALHERLKTFTNSNWPAWIWDWDTPPELNKKVLFENFMNSLFKIDIKYKTIFPSNNSIKRGGTREELQAYSEIRDIRDKLRGKENNIPKATEDEIKRLDRIAFEAGYKIWNWDFMFWDIKHTYVTQFQKVIIPQLKSKGYRTRLPNNKIKSDQAMYCVVRTFRDRALGKARYRGKKDHIAALPHEIQAIEAIASREYPIWTWGKLLKKDKHLMLNVHT